MVSVASLTIVGDPLRHFSDSERNSCGLGTAVRFALHVKKNELPLAAKEKVRITQTVQICKVRSFCPQERL